MQKLHFDCFSGISGDMVLGALLDIRQNSSFLISELSKLGLDDEFTLKVEKGNTHSIAGANVHVLLASEEGHAGHHHAHMRTLDDINAIIDDSSLSLYVKDMAKKVFLTIAEAEAKVHGTDIQKVHFHEVGAVDSIVDIVGACILLDALGEVEVSCSAINVGSGTVYCAHRTLPVPAPATAELLQGIPVFSNEIQGELATPTGVALIKTFAAKFGGTPDMKIEKIGYGLGKRDTGSPNGLRAILGTADENSNDMVFEIQANIDDMTGEALSYACEKLFEAGAVDVWQQPIYMKKGRVGAMLCAICKGVYRDSVIQAIFRNTTTIGIRFDLKSREVLQRESVSVDTAFGEIPAKRIKRCGTEEVVPEYEACRAVAEKHGVSLKAVYEAVVAKDGI